MEDETEMFHQTANTNMVKDTTVVDADVHVSISKDQLVKYLDEPHRRTVKNNWPMITSYWDQYLGGKIEKRPSKTPEDFQSLREFWGDYLILNASGKLSIYPQADLAVNLMRAYNDSGPVLR